MPIASRQATVTPAAGQAESDKRVTAGLRWLWGQPTVLRILAFAGVVNLVAAATQVTVVVSLRGQGTPAGAIGAVMACCGVGTVVGALLARRIMERLDAARLCLTLGVLFAAGFASFTLSSSPWVLGPVLGVVFLLSPAAGITLATITMGEAPKHLLGRVSTAEQMVTTTLATVGPVLAGLTLQTLGPSSTWLGLGACCLLATVLAILPMFAHREPAGTTATPADAPAAALGPR
jgi:predicted MFS family arabinose efflux permease